MPTRQVAYQDYYFGVARRISQRPRVYPFFSTGDVTSYTYVVAYAIDIDFFTPVAPLTADPENAAAFLIAQSAPQIEQGRLATFTRTYASAFPDQVRFGNMALSKPQFPTQDYSLYWVDTLAVGATAGIFSPVLSATSLNAPTGGTFTITHTRGGSSTTAALAWNATAAAITTAINALATVTAVPFSVLVTGNAAGRDWVINRAAASPGGFNGSEFTYAVAGLTPTVASVATNAVDQAAVSFFTSVLNIARTAHGLAVAAPVRYLIAGATTGGGTLAAVNTVVDANNFTVLISPPNSPPTVTGIRTRTRTYAAGTSQVRTRLTEKFTAAGSAIPKPPDKLSDATFLTSILAAATGFVEYSWSNPSFWNGSSRYVYEITEFESADL